jgi:hypothetical protein
MSEEEEKEEEMEAPPTPEEVEEEIEKLSKGMQAAEKEIEKTESAEEIKETETEKTEFAEEAEKTGTKEEPAESDIDRLIRETPAGEGIEEEIPATPEKEIPVSPEEQEERIAEDIRDAGEEIRKEIRESAVGETTGLAKAAEEIEDEAFKSSLEEEGKISDAAKEEEAELKEEITEKEEFFRKKYIDDIKEEIGHLKEEIVQEMGRPKPERLRHIIEETKAVEKEYAAAAESGKWQDKKLATNDPSRLFEELKARGTLRGVKVPAPRKEKLTPQDIIRKSLKQDVQKKTQSVPTAWELLQRKKIKESSK